MHLSWKIFENGLKKKKSEKKEKWSVVRALLAPRQTHSSPPLVSQQHDYKLKTIPEIRALALVEDFWQLWVPGGSTVNHTPTSNQDSQDEPEPEEDLKGPAAKGLEDRPRLPANLDGEGCLFIKIAVDVSCLV